MKKYIKITKKSRYWAYLEDETGYRKSRRLIKKDSKGEYIMVEGVKRYV